MAIHAAIHHLTHYVYEKPAKLGPQTIRLRPAPHCRTPILSYSLKVSPKDHFVNWQQDPYSNYLARIVFPERIKEFKIEVDLVAEMSVYNPFDFFLEPDYEEYHERKLEASMEKELESYLKTPLYSELLNEYITEIDTDKEKTIDFLVSLNAKLQNDIGYTIRMEPGIQTPSLTLKKRTGSCRDTAWLLIHILRHFKFAARFVSGYLLQLTPDEKSLDGPSGPEADFTDLHAWVEVYLPGAGWIGLDPTSGLLAGEGHIPVACAPEPKFASPISGALEKVETAFNFDMSISRIAEVPRISKPYSDDAWERLLKTGDQVDKLIEEHDIRLTMGGEPTFISIDNMDGPEWNTEAVGPQKKALSEQLLKKMWVRFAPKGFLHYGQGKWYPGEPLPRWAFSCYWRKDGKPLWNNKRLLAEIDKDYGFGPDEAKKFAQTLAKTLKVRVDTLMPAYEDTWYYLWKERKLPVNVDPIDNKLRQSEERERLAKLFEEGLDVPKGWVLPLQKLWQAKHIWTSTPWDIRQPNLYLTPGDSPIGLRLPLETLPWIRQNDYPYIVQQDPSIVQQNPLFDTVEKVRQFRKLAEESLESKEADEPRQPDNPNVTARTALCIEPRDGKLFIFFPPVSSLEDYLELLSAIEATAGALDYPVVIEGEKPPKDSRINMFSVTPDPGVIEVNIQPAESWKELTYIVSSIYEDARLCRLGTNKFMLDGRHTGTGGGNHIILGGKTPEDSPFLRRPDLLQSMVAYWHHHPSLSYLFSSLFIGPTSQSPRLDEARDDALYEMEIAFEEVKNTPTPCPPWLVDRIFRNLLVDITGNTHRAEICIDKLYNPEAANGRLGLVEFRSFEMPPNARMSLAQNLVIRALVTRFWIEPYTPLRLMRWGTDLHDRMLLPHYIWEDFMEVLDDLNSFGIPVERDWFKSHLEFRFPYYGTFQYKDIEVDIRQALEPWHVMGEEGSTGGAVRFVDSSLERIQVKAKNFNSNRYILCCNGCKIPMKNTGKQGEYVAAVRFRAWQPASALHPTIPVDAPLTIDLLDTWNMRPVAGCRYHVAHPGGKAYEVFPVNAYEAESRRLSRFEARGHTPGGYTQAPREKESIDFPNTLDLRRFSSIK